VASGAGSGTRDAEEGSDVRSALLASVLIAGCASVPLADSTQDSVSKTFVAPPGRALIYVVRDGGWVSGAWQIFRVSLDRHDHGALSDGTYFVFEVDPGPHAIRAAGNENQERVQIETKAAGLYFVSVRSRIGIANARVSVSLLPDDEGKAAIL
jgi:hypothetical protein